MRALALTALLMAGGCAHRQAASAVAAPEATLVGHELDFTLKAFPDHSSFKLSSLKGKVVLLDVWATWCDPCRDAMPFYAELQKQLGPKGLQVVLLNVDADESQVAKFVSEVKLELPVVLDPNAGLAEETLKVKVMPTTFFVDRQGKVRQLHEGFADDFVAKATAELEALLAEPLAPGL